MRWNSLRRSLSISAPRAIVSGTPSWRRRWALWALAAGLLAGVGLGAFEFGRDSAGADIASLRSEVERLRGRLSAAPPAVGAADSLLKAEQATRERLAQQIKQLEGENLALKTNLDFFEHVLPTGADTGLSVRNLHGEASLPGQLRFQFIVLQAGGAVREFSGRYEITLAGLLDDKPWAYTSTGPSKPLRMKQYLRVEGIVDHAARAVVKTIQVRVLDASGGVKATQTVPI